MGAWGCLAHEPTKVGGESGIRTHERIAPLRDFQSRLFGHSSTSPVERLYKAWLYEACGHQYCHFPTL